jgi:imidazolonepropionase-like amidohydrolase
VASGNGINLVKADLIFILRRNGGTMMQVDYLFKHGTVITMDKERRIIEDGSVAIKKNRIVDVGTTNDFERSN